MGIVGCYSVHLYCDHPDAAKHVCPDFPAEFTGKSERNCLAEARKHGWKISSTTVLCPKHRDKVD